MTRKTPSDEVLDELVGALREAGDMMRRQHGTKARLSYDEAADAIWCLRRDLRVLADALEQAVKERAEVNIGVRRIQAQALRDAAYDFDRAAAAGIEPTLNHTAARLLRDRAHRLEQMQMQMPAALSAVLSEGEPS